MKIQINNKQNIFFCSDPHYGHSGIVAGTSKWEDKNGCREFQTIDSMNNTLVNNINQSVGVDDILFCLGDWSFGSYKTGENISNIKEFREQINCKQIHLIFGNHDQEIIYDKNNSRDLFSSATYYREIIVMEHPLEQNQKAAKQKIVLSHYSHRVWNNMQGGAWMLFGHSHGNLQGVEGKSMDVGFDTREEFKPYSYEEIKSIMNNKETVKLDHHG
jgi:calcineurin-like phosphoesterase family protein